MSHNVATSAGAPFTLEVCLPNYDWVMETMTTTRRGGLTSGGRRSVSTQRRYRLKNRDGRIVAAWTAAGRALDVESGRVIEPPIMCACCHQIRVKIGGVCRRCEENQPDELDLATVASRAEVTHAQEEARLDTLRKPAYVAPERPPVILMRRGELVEFEIVWDGR